MVGSSGDQPQVLLSESHLINVNTDVVERGFLWISRQLYYSYHLGNSKGISNSVPVTRTMDKYQIYSSYYKSHCHTFFRGL